MTLPARDYARRQDNHLFDPQAYLLMYPDVLKSGIDPFAHYVHCGYFEGRFPCTREALIAFEQAEGLAPSSPALVVSPGRDGHMTCLEQQPAVLDLADHIYVPQGEAACHPGVYDFGGKLVHQSAYSRGPNPSDVLPTKSMPFSYLEASHRFIDGSYIYLGAIYSHFGHFLMSTASRLWNIGSLPDLPILCYGADPKNLPAYQCEFFRSFGVDISRLIIVKEVSRIARLILPCPCLEEKNFVHRVFGRSFNMAGDVLAGKSELFLPGSGPVYLGKSKLTSGVRAIVNEGEIEEDLARAGFTIIHPERLAICDQVACWRLGRPIVSFSGSGLHTAAFSSDAEIVNIRWNDAVDTTFPLVDWACNHRSRYYHFEPAAFIDLGPSTDFDHQKGFSSRLKAFDPQQVSKAICDLVL